MKRADLADVEAYARGEFLTDGSADKEVATRVADKVATLTGIDQAVSRRPAGRPCRRIHRKNGKLTAASMLPCVALILIRIRQPRIRRSLEQHALAP
ncbi:hypothetical protein BCCGELA001_29755 [Bradyrhizobium sp. CCGE-LA001]|nr:hypothetical protein BCCGELA001_29755 [Bradyrhizobium sp. CCGE-LA001]